MEKRGKCLLGVMLVCSLLITTGFGSQKEMKKSTVNLPTVSGASYVGDETCKACHEAIASSFKTTYHEGKANCESCHGPGSLHASSQDPKDIITFKQDDIPTMFAYSSQCLSCHAKNKKVMYYKTSAHFTAGIACTSCHSVHVKKSTKIASTLAQPYYESVAKGFLKEQEPMLCYNCHGEIRAKTFYPSHHPIKEGKMVCSDCHVSHGGTVGMLKTKERLNEMCYQCHPDKRGPFAFEHAPVEEDCTICHEPHGTTAFNLLKNSEPILCLQCHHSHFQIAEHKDFQYTASVRCTQCHSRIHGSNYPSQGAPFGGRALTR
jgi:DmsE family decaheme c-type cytochrome